MLVMSHLTRRFLRSLCNDCTKTREEAERLRAATSHSEMERHQLASRVRVLAEQRQHILLEAAARRTQIPLDELIKAKVRALLFSWPSELDKPGTPEGPTRAASRFWLLGR